MKLSILILSSLFLFALPTLARNNGSHGSGGGSHSSNREGQGRHIEMNREQRGGENHRVEQHRELNQNWHMDSPHNEMRNRTPFNGRYFNGRFIDHDYFHSHYGYIHRFRIIQEPVFYAGYYRFYSSGFWFGYVDYWPYFDDGYVYIDQDYDTYWLCNARYPGLRVRIWIIIN